MPEEREKRSLTMIAYDQIKDGIYAGDIVSGETISEVQLSRQLNMSRTPVHNALQLLEREGSVSIISGIGVQVNGISYHDIKSLYAVRMELEILAASTAVGRITEEELDSLKGRLLELRRLPDLHTRANQEAWLALDDQLHQLLIDKCDNVYIKIIMKMIYRNVRRYRRISVQTDNRVQDSIDRHLAYIEMLRAGDVQRLREAFRKDIDWSLEIEGLNES